MALEVIAMRLKRARAPLADGDLGLEAIKPPAGDGLKAKSR